MKIAKEKKLFLGILLFLVLMACTVQQWLPVILNFINLNTSLIQGLASVIQIVLWFGAFILFLGSLYSEDRLKSSKSHRKKQKQPQSPSEQLPCRNAEQSTSYSVNANTIHSVTQGNNNQTIMNFNEPHDNE